MKNKQENIENAQGRNHFFVREESLLNFLNVSERDFDRMGFSIHSLMKDKLVIPRTKLPVDNNDFVMIKISDEARERRSKLTNTYFYQVQGYDDLSYELILFDFKVNQEELK